MKHADELINACNQANIDCTQLSKEEAATFIGCVLYKFAPMKCSGHLSIQNDSLSAPLEPHEFSYSDCLGNETVYVFFEQDGFNKNSLVSVTPGKDLFRALEHAYGMEYFVTNEQADYLLAVNWYVIEAAGSAKDWISRLDE